MQPYTRNHHGGGLWQWIERNDGHRCYIINPAGYRASEQQIGRLSSNPELEPVTTWPPQAGEDIPLAAPADRAYASLQDVCRYIAHDYETNEDTVLNVCRTNDAHIHIDTGSARERVYVRDLEGEEMLDTTFGSTSFQIFATNNTWRMGRNMPPLPLRWCERRRRHYCVAHVALERVVIDSVPDPIAEHLQQYNNDVWNMWISGGAIVSGNTLNEDVSAATEPEAPPAVVADPWSVINPTTLP